MEAISRACATDLPEPPERARDTRELGLRPERARALRVGFRKSEGAS
jgi:hypothetical protein